MNPFIISGYISPGHFCDREKETQRLINSVENNRNLTLYSLRRIGKTNLIYHLFNKLGKRNHIECLYVDLFPTNNLKDFIKKIAESVLASKKNHVKYLNEIAKIFKKITPKITLDSLTGQPSLEFGYMNSEEASYSLDEIFSYLAEKSKNTKIVIALDEFQQILNYTEKNVEALLRSKIQSLKNIVFIFSGSSKGMISSMFTDIKRPFYSSTEMMYLDKINAESYKSFISEMFRKSKYTISTELIDDILNWNRIHTFYVQYFCNRLFSQNIKNIGVKDVMELKKNILAEFKEFFINYKNVLTPQQYNFIKAVAKEKNVNAPTGNEFLSKYKLGAASTVISIITALLKKEIIYKESDSIFVYDVYLSRWLEEQ